MIDPQLVIPDPSLSLNEGAIEPWSASNGNHYHEQLLKAACDHFQIDMDKPFQDLSQKENGYSPLRFR